MSTGGVPVSDGNAGGLPATAPWAGVAEGQTWQVEGKPWYETTVAEPEIREAIAAKKYAHPGVLAKSYVELERQLASRDDSKMIRIPDENASPKDWDAVFTKLGRPADPSGYKDVKWGDNADPRMVEFASNLAFKLGLPPKMAESIMATEWNNFVAAQTQQSNQTSTQQQETALAELKAEWKGDFDANRARGQQVLQSLTKAGLSDADMAAVEKAAGIAPVVKLLATIGKLSGEGSFMDNINGGGPVSAENMTPEQAKAEIVKLTADNDFQKTYMTPNVPGHKEALARMEQLYARVGTTVT